MFRYYVIMNLSGKIVSLLKKKLPCDKIDFTGPLSSIPSKLMLLDPTVSLALAARTASVFSSTLFSSSVKSPIKSAVEIFEKINLIIRLSCFSFSQCKIYNAIKIEIAIHFWIKIFCNVDCDKLK